MTKAVVFSKKVEDGAELVSILGFQMNQLPFNYLEVPITGKAIGHRDCSTSPRNWTTSYLGGANGVFCTVVGSNSSHGYFMENSAMFFKAVFSPNACTIMAISSIA